jgi:hypothetical protein
VTYDPLDGVQDQLLQIDAGVLHEIALFRSQPKLSGLPGVDTSFERERLSKVLNDIADALVLNVSANPSKRWVMGQFQSYLESVATEDTEGREHFGMEMERLMHILGIESSDGLLGFYLGGM